MVSGMLQIGAPEAVRMPDSRGIQLLGPAEALLAYLVDYDASYLWVVRSDAAEMHKIEISSEELADKVTELRRALDPTGVQSLDDMRQFDVALAHELYTLIFAPAEPLFHRSFVR